MSKITVITDTDSSLPVELAEKYNIRQVPISIHFGEETFATGRDIGDAALFDRVDREKKMPTTSAPTPGDFAEAYEEAFKDGADAVVCICVSSIISATYTSAVTASEMFPQRKIAVVDSLSVSMGQGFMAMAAVEAARDGASLEEIVACAVDVGKRTHLYAILPTLKYLAMGGRVGKLAAGAADTLNIKPILTSRDGKLDLLEKIRTQKKATSRLLELTRLALDGKAVERLAMLHVNNKEGALVFQELLLAELERPDEIYMAEFTPGLSVHTGSGVVGLAMLAAK